MFEDKYHWLRYRDENYVEGRIDIPKENDARIDLINLSNHFNCRFLSRDDLFTDDFTDILTYKCLLSPLDYILAQPQTHWS